MHIYLIHPLQLPAFRKHFLITFLRSIAIVLIIVIAQLLISGRAPLKQIDVLATLGFLTFLIAFNAYGSFKKQTKQNRTLKVTIDDKGISREIADDDVISIAYTDVRTVKQSDLSREILISGHRWTKRLTIPYDMENYKEAIQLLEQHIQIQKRTRLSSVLNSEFTFLGLCIILFSYGVCSVTNPALLAYVITGIACIVVASSLLIHRYRLQGWTKTGTFILLLIYAGVSIYWFLTHAGLY